MQCPPCSGTLSSPMSRRPHHPHSPPFTHIHPHSPPLPPITGLLGLGVIGSGIPHPFTHCDHAQGDASLPFLPSRRDKFYIINSHTWYQPFRFGSFVGSLGEPGRGFLYICSTAPSSLSMDRIVCTFRTHHSSFDFSRGFA